MYGAIIGDIVGSKYEFRPIKTKEFPFVSEGCGYRDNWGEPGYRGTGLKGDRDWPEFCEDIVGGCGIDGMLPAEFVETIEVFDSLCFYRAGAYDRMGMCASIGEPPCL